MIQQFSLLYSGVICEIILLLLHLSYWTLLPFEQIRELVPESQAYMDLLAFERKLDQTIMRKRVDIQEALKRPMKVLANSEGLICTYCMSIHQSDVQFIISVSVLETCVFKL